MSIVVGVAPGHDNAPAVRLGVLLARSYSRPLVLVAVSAVASPLILPRIDTEYRGHIVAVSQEVLAEAARLVPDDVDVRTLVREARSIRRGLLEVCAEVDAMRLVVGSAEDSELGTIRLGSVSTGLLQSAELPVAIAPAGFELPSVPTLQRVTAAFNGSSTAAELVRGAAAVAGLAGAVLRIAAFAPRPESAITGVSAGSGVDAEDQLVREWTDVIRSQTAELLDDADELSGRTSEVVVGVGPDWDTAVRAIGWKDAEVLLIGSSTLGPLTRLSLGSRAAKIIKHSPVPVVLVPRKAKESYAAQAD